MPLFSGSNKDAEMAELVDATGRRQSEQYGKNVSMTATG